MSMGACLSCGKEQTSHSLPTELPVAPIFSCLCPHVYISKLLCFSAITLSSSMKSCLLADRQTSGANRLKPLAAVIVWIAERVRSISCNQTQLHITVCCVRLHSSAFGTFATYIETKIFSYTFPCVLGVLGRRALRVPAKHR